MSVTLSWDLVQLEDNKNNAILLRSRLREQRINEKHIKTYIAIYDL